MSLNKSAYSRVKAERLEAASRLDLSDIEQIGNTNLGGAVLRSAVNRLVGDSRRLENDPASIVFASKEQQQPVLPQSKPTNTLDEKLSMALRKLD